MVLRSAPPYSSNNLSNETPPVYLADSGSFAGMAETSLGFVDQYTSEPRLDLYLSTDPSPILQALRDPKTRFIDIEIYTMKDRDVRAAIRDALQRGVRVRIIKEPTPVNESCKLFPGFTNDPLGAADLADCVDQQALVHEVGAAAASGSVYVAFNKQQLCANPDAICFEHGKLVVINNAVALVSTGNFDSTNLCNVQYNPDRCNRDYTIVTSVPGVVKTLEAVFDKDLQGKRYDLAGLLRSVGSPQVTVNPLDPDHNQIIAFIDSARESILIQEQYLKEPRINEALIRAAKRKGKNGRNVRVMVNVASPCSFGKPKKGEAAKFTEIYKAFDAAGVVSRIFTDLQKVGGKPGYLHAKAIVVDGKRAWVGSINGSTTSVGNNREFGVFFDDAAAVQKLVRQMQEDLASPDSETWQEGLNCTKDTARNKH